MERMEQVAVSTGLFRGNAHGPTGSYHQTIIAMGLASGAALALGLSRFAYGLLLPPMQEDLGWNFFQAGTINTANGAGYIIGAVLSALVASRWGTVRAFLAAYIASVAVLLALAVTRDLSALIALRTIGGATTALTFILGASLTSSICPTASPGRRGALVGVYVAGVSIGVLLAGAIVPYLVAERSADWPRGWLALGVIGLLLLPAAWAGARSISEPAGPKFGLLDRASFKSIAPTFISYGIFGAGYVIYITFVLALLKRQGGTPAQAALFWFTLGLVSCVSNVFWGTLLGRLKGGHGPALVFAASAFGVLPLLLGSGTASMLLSAVLFGGSFMAGPTAITIVAQKHVPQSQLTAAISMLTVSFALGQTVGPVIAGMVSDGAGNLSLGFWASPVLLFLAALLAFRQRAEEGTVLDAT